MTPYSLCSERLPTKDLHRPQSNRTRCAWAPGPETLSLLGVVDAVPPAGGDGAVEAYEARLQGTSAEVRGNREEFTGQGLSWKNNFSREVVRTKSHLNRELPKKGMIETQKAPLETNFGASTQTRQK